MIQNHLKKAYEYRRDNDGVEGSFAGLSNALGEYSISNFTVIPVPFEGTVSFGGGTANGPCEIIEASRNIEYMDQGTRRHPFIYGIHTTSPVIGETHAEIMDKLFNTCVKCYTDGKIPVVLGGEHSISAAPIRAAASKWNNLGVLQLDAHSDLRDKFYGDPNSHACVMRRALEMPHVSKISQVGIRSSSWYEAEVIADEEKLNTLFIDALNESRWIEKAVDALPQNVYVTLDVDAFDPAYIPATGTPEPNGMNWSQVLSLLAYVFEHRNVVGFDLVELAPIEGLLHPQASIAVLTYRMMAWLSMAREKTGNPLSVVPLP